MSKVKTHHHGKVAVGAFAAATPRPLFAEVCRNATWHQRLGKSAMASQVSCAHDRPSLAELVEGPYYTLALMLDATALCRADATCRLLRQLNRACVGPWRALGALVFNGLELEREGTFEQPAVVGDCLDGGLETSCAIGNAGRKFKRIDWKGRFRHFRADVATFCHPFLGKEIAVVAHPDEVAYFRCRLCTDVLDEACKRGIYLEVEVLVNPDNLSMAVVDFEAGGCSSVTFSPDTGAVIRERKVREAPRKVEGAYIQPLPTVPSGRRFHGVMGLYLQQGRLAFFRRCVAQTAVPESSGTAVSSGAAEPRTPPAWQASSWEMEDLPTMPSAPPLSAVDVPGERCSRAEGVEMEPWETTGFVSDLSWAEGRRLTPCLAFRDEGSYSVRVVCVGTDPPIPIEQWACSEGKRDPEGSTDDAVVGWSGFDWEVGPPALGELLDTAGV